MYKKIALLIFISSLLASCVARKINVSYPKADTPLQKHILGYGMKYLNRPYRYAGKGPNAFDCAGFTSFVFREFGYSLSPSSSGQYRQFPGIDDRKELRPGDLVFFEGRSHNGNVGHIGIVKDVLGKGHFTFLHASTNNGVIISRSTEPYYASRYIRGGRVLNENPVYTEQQNQSKKKKSIVFNPAASNEGPEIQNAQSALSGKAGEPAETVFDDIHMSGQNNSSNNHVTLLQANTHENSSPGRSQSDSRRDGPESGTVFKADICVALREDSVIVPKPAVIKIGEDGPLKHTVKMGETLYSISRQFNCSIEQLKSWNPHLGPILMAGDTLTILSD